MRSGLNVDDLELRLTATANRCHLGDAVQRVRQLAGGASSLTFAADLHRGDTVAAIVVKVAPPDREPVGHRDVLRQARVLHALARSGSVPVPIVLFEDFGDPPSIPPLFGMSFVAGESVEPLFDRAPATTATHAEIAARAHEAARSLAALQRTKLDAVASEMDTVDLRAEVDRWATALASVADADRLRWRDVHQELLQSIPLPGPLVLGHGDYRLGNMLASGRSVNAVIDWELWAATDARVDLAWFRLNADPAAYNRETPLAQAMPEADDLLTTYIGPTGQEAPVNLAWFDALARFKATATWSLILKMSEHTGDSLYSDVSGTLPGLLAGAARMLR
jgi:aminoglycoside phosphotransferase (APT) family kinase protein